MAADYNKPTVSSPYTSFPQEIVENIRESTSMFEGSVGANVPFGAKRIGNSRLVERWDGFAWVALGYLSTGSTMMNFKGNYDASINTPTLSDGSGNTGDTYRVNVAGTGVNSIVFNVGDWVYYNGSVWLKGDNTDAVSSVAGKTGAVTLDKNDVGLNSVQNYGIASTAESQAGTVDNKYSTPLKVKQEIDQFRSRLVALNYLSGAGSRTIATASQSLSSLPMQAIQINITAIVYTSTSFYGVDSIVFELMEGAVVLDTIHTMGVNFERTGGSGFAYRATLYPNTSALVGNSSYVNKTVSVRARLTGASDWTIEDIKATLLLVN